MAFNCFEKSSNVYQRLCRSARHASIAVFTSGRKRLRLLTTVFGLQTSGYAVDVDGSRLLLSVPWLSTTSKWALSLDPGSSFSARKSAAAVDCSKGFTEQQHPRRTSQLSRSVFSGQPRADSKALRYQHCKGSIAAQPNAAITQTRISPNPIKPFPSHQPPSPSPTARSPPAPSPSSPSCPHSHPNPSS